MTDQDRDWLDDKMATRNYIPDGGFTARVVDQLPKSQPEDGRLRQAILILSSVFAIAIATGLLTMQLGPWRESIDLLFSRSGMVAEINHLALLAKQPAVLYGVSGGFVILGFAAIPFLRRWV